jgi:hypothetical protein
MTKISYSIMATKERKDMAEALSKSLGGIPISYDDGSGIWENRVKAMQMCGKESDFVCVLQDDAIPCTNFFEEVRSMIISQPDFMNKAYCLYFGNRKNMIEMAEGGLKAGGIETDWISWGVGIVLPTKIVDNLILFYINRNEYLRNDDTRIARYLRKIGMKTYYPMPSLVDHRHEVKSLMDNSEGVKMRKAYKFKG